MQLFGISCNNNYLPNNMSTRDKMIIRNENTDNGLIQKSYLLQTDTTTNTSVLHDVTDPANKEKYYDELDYRMEDMASVAISKIPNEYRKEYCVIFGDKIFYHSANYDEAIKEYNTASQFLAVGFYTPC